MFKLVQNEFLKLHAKKSMYILIGIITLIEIIGAVIVWKLGKDEFYLENIIGMIMVFTTIFGISIASRIITEEFQKGTIKQLLIRPRKRIEILFSKYITVLLASLFIVVASTLIAMIIDLIVMDGSKTEFTLGVVLKMISYQFLPLIFYVTLAFFLANIFRKSVLPLIITVIVFFLEQTIAPLFMFLGEGIAKFIVFFHLDLSVYDSNKLISDGTGPLFLGFTFTTSLLLVLAYISALLIGSILLFQKRDVL